MGNWLKENWFKLGGVLVIVGVVAALFMVRIEQKEDSFARKQECASYIDAIERKLKEISIGELIYGLDQVFYSPQRNSCLYSYHNYALGGYYIADYLTNENVWGWGGITDVSERERSWRSAIEELKR